MAIGFYLLRDSSSANFGVKDRNSKIAYILDLIDKQYVDKTNQDSLADDAIRALLAELDPHSVYLTAEEVKRENDDLNGNFEGIGIQFRIVGDSIAVVRTLSGGQSEKVGVLAGDRIVKVNGRKLKNISNDTVQHLLKAKRKYR